MRARITIAWVAWLMLFAAPGCVLEAERPVRIGMNPWPGYGFVQLAAAQHYFDEAGTPVRIVELTSNGDAQAAFLRGQIDILASTTIGVASMLRQAQIRPWIFHVCDFSNGADVILARTSIEDIGQLKGRRVAAEPDSLDLVLLARALASKGLKLEDIQFIPLPQLEIPEAFRKREIDAAATYPPTSFALVEAGAHEIFNSSQIPGVIVDVLVTTREFARDHRKSLADIRAAVQRAIRYAEAHPDRAYTIMARKLGLSKAQLEQALTGIRITPQEEQAGFFGPNGLLVQSLRSSTEVLRKTNPTDRSIVADNTIRTAVPSEPGR